MHRILTRDRTMKYAKTFLLTLAACTVRRIQTPYICKRLPI